MLTPSWALEPLSAPAYAMVTPLHVALPSPAGFAASAGTGIWETTGRFTGPLEPEPDPVPPPELALLFVAHAPRASDSAATAVTARASRAADTQYLQ